MIPIAKPIIEEEEKKAVMDVLNSGMLAQGSKVKELEETFAKICGTKYAVAVNSGTAAIHTALYAIGIKEGDEIITTPFTFVATANPILMQRAKIVFADINKDTFNLDPADVKKKITKKTKAIISVDLFGQPADYNELNKIANEHNIILVEDACQAVNAEYEGKKTGSLAKVAAFSLYATKNITSGEGGLLTTNDEEIYDKARMFRHHGQSEKTKYQYFDLGYNYRMTDMQAAIALAQLKKLDDFTNKRIKNAKLLSEGLKNIPGIKIPAVISRAKHVFHQYTIKVDGFKKTRDEIMEYLKSNGVGSAVFYPKPLHLHPHFMKLGYNEGDFPIAEQVAKQVLSLPIHPSVTDRDIKTIIESFKAA
ncbi:MAG: DegT/DnrJ/EryC1/StrS family aminotransferase [Nanoarchaeota archaeon]